MIRSYGFRFPLPSLQKGGPPWGRGGKTMARWFGRDRRIGRYMGQSRYSGGKRGAAMGKHGGVCTRVQYCARSSLRGSMHSCASAGAIRFVGDDGAHSRQPTHACIHIHLSNHLHRTCPEYVGLGVWRRLWVRQHKLPDTGFCSSPPSSEALPYVQYSTVQTKAIVKMPR